jgi:hypothetical protein
MSYDLMVFDPQAGPANVDDFEAWFAAKMEEIDESRIQNPETTAPVLRAWYRDMTAEFPDYNATERDLGDAAAGYSSCPSAIYADFRWSKAQEAYKRVTELAAKHQVGFFDVSGTKGQVWAPRGGQYVLLFELKP